MRWQHRDQFSFIIRFPLKDSHYKRVREIDERHVDGEMECKKPLGIYCGTCHSQQSSSSFLLQTLRRIVGEDGPAGEFIQQDTRSSGRS